LESNDPLQRLRKQIDLLDQRLVRLLNQRARVARSIGLIKARQGASIFSPDREEQVYANALKANRGPLSDETLRAILREVLSGSRALVRPVLVAFQGPAMSFAHMAAQRVFGSQATYVPCETIGEVFAKVERSEADHGVVPLENALEGTVGYTLDCLVDTDLCVAGEVFQPIHHHLAGMVKLERIRRLYVHPQAHAQCRRWLETHLPRVRMIETLSTSMSAAMAREHAKDSAAVTSEEAARRYRLKILARSIGDSHKNLTRFLILSGAPAEPTGRDKTSLVFSIKDRIGALHDLLAPFKRYRINLTKIESRPSRRRAWDYYFFLDLEGHLSEPRIARAIAAVKAESTWLKVLGSYPKGTSS
jgi:chorismate mutase/prephenate dehydratase